MVRNDFSVPIEAVAFRSEACRQFEVWFCDRIEPGQSANAKIIRLADAAEELKGEVRRRGSETVFGSGRIVRQRSHRRYNYYGGEINESENSDVAVALNSFWNLSDSELGQMLQLENDRSYVAITDRSTNHEMPIDNPKVECEIHLVIGVR